MGPDFEMERAAMASGRVRVAGVDEVGRGPLAGPVTAAAVILDPARIPDGLNDSKQLSAKRRLALAEILAEGALTGVGHASVAEIEQHNILRASHLAMRRAIAALSVVPDLVLIDDKTARNIAEYLGINVKGTLGVLVEAKRKGLISSFKEPALKMKKYGIRFSEQLINEISSSLEE